MAEGACSDRITRPDSRGWRRPLPAFHADREQVIDTLKAAFVHGMLTKDELDQRVGQAFASKTYAELAALWADLPAGSAWPRSEPRTRPTRTQGRSLGDKKVLQWAIVGVLSPLVPLAAALVIQSQLILAVLFVMLVLDLIVGLPFLMIVVGTMIEERRQQRRSHGSPGQPPPGRGGRPPGGRGAAGPVTIPRCPVGAPTGHAPRCERTSGAPAGGVTRCCA